MDEHERPVEVERETTVINTGGGGGGGSPIVALLVVAVIAVAAFLCFGGYLQRAADDVDVNVNVEAPKIELPDVNINLPPPSQPTNSQ